MFFFFFFEIAKLFQPKIAFIAVVEQQSFTFKMLAAAFWLVFYTPHTP